MMNFSGLVNLGAKGLKIGVVTICAAAIGELGYIGTRALESDVEFTSNVAKELKNPTPIAVKPKRFGKVETVTVHPLTGETKAYKGNKSAVNAKNPVKLYK